MGQGKPKQMKNTVQTGDMLAQHSCYSYASKEVLANNPVARALNTPGAKVCQCPYCLELMDIDGERITTVPA